VPKKSKEAQGTMDPTTNHINRMHKAILLDSSVDIENSTPSIEYNLSNLDSLQKHVDRHSFSDYPFVDELSVVAELESILQHGNEHKHMLYTFRSCARALPRVNTKNEDQKADIYQATWKVLRPVMEKVKDVMDFQHVVVQKFATEIKRLSTTIASHVSGSDMLFEQLIQILDLIAILDHLKDNKTSIKDDFNCYKRTFHNVQNSLSNMGMLQQEIERLQLFLSDPRHPRRYIFHQLKFSLALPCEPVLVLLIHYCMNKIEHDLGITPEEKCQPIRVLPVLMNLIDGLGTSTSRLNGAADSKEKMESINIFKHKSIDLYKLSKILKARPVVPLYMDMHVKLQILLRDCPNFDMDDSSMRKTWCGDDDHELFLRAYSLENESRWSEYRRSHSSYMVQLQRAMNQISMILRRKDTECPDLPMSEYEVCTTLLLQGIRLLSELTTAVQYQCAWKCGHSASCETTIDKDTNELVVPVEGVVFALATVHNYSRSEMRVLIDVISMIKSLASLLRKAEGIFASVVRTHIHRKTQLFIQHTLLQLLYKAHKHKRTEELQLLLQMRSLSADWIEKIEPFEDYKSKQKVHDVRSAYEALSTSASSASSSAINNIAIQEAERSEHLNAELKAEKVAPIPMRSVAPSASQLRLMRSMVRALYDERAPWSKKGGLFTSGTFTKKDLGMMTTFYNHSKDWIPLLNISKMIKLSSDVSSLWYREFYLEMTKQVQFPISMSLPWRLAEYGTAKVLVSSSLFLALI